MGAWLECCQFGDATLYLGDSREVLPTLDPVDLVVSDPPYLLTGGGASRGSGSHKVMQGGWMADYANGGAVVACDIGWREIVDLCFGALTADADCYLMANDKNVFPAQAAAERAGFRLHNLLVWHKVSCTANRWFMKECEFTLYLFKGRARTILTPGEKQLSRIPQRDETRHPTEKPVLEMERYIRASARPDERVLDPFMGTGTTGVAALRAGRRFIGVEIDRKWFDVACGRIAKAAEEPRVRGLFDDPYRSQGDLIGGVA